MPTGESRAALIILGAICLLTAVVLFALAWYDHKNRRR